MCPIPFLGMEYIYTMTQCITLLTIKDLAMNEIKKQLELTELRQIPGVGEKISQDLWNLGIRSVRDLKEQHPETLYDRLCLVKQMPVDRCMLYVFRCAVYYASEKHHEPELLNWWNWKDHT